MFRRGVVDSAESEGGLQKRNGPCVDGHALTKAQFVVPTDVWYDDASDCVWVADRWWLRKLNLNTLVVSTEWESPNRERFSVEPFDNPWLNWTEWSDIEKLAPVSATHPSSPHERQFWPLRPTKRKAELPLEATESLTSDLKAIVVTDVAAGTTVPSTVVVSHVAGYHVPGDATDSSGAAIRARSESVRLSDCGANGPVPPPVALPCDERFYKIRCVLSFPARVPRDNSQSNATAASAGDERDGCDESLLIASERALRWLYRKRQPLAVVAAAVSGTAAASASVRCSGIVTDADPACESDQYHIETFQFRSVVAPPPAAAAATPAAAATDTTATDASATTDATETDAAAEEWKFDPIALARHPFDSDRFYVAANSIIYGCSLPSTPQYTQSIASALHRTFESYSALYPLPHELTELIAQYLIRPVLTVDLTIHSPAAAPTRIPYAKLSSYVHNTQREHIYRTRQYYDVCALACVPAIASGRDESGGVRLIVAAYDPVDAMYACDASRDSAASASRFQVLTTSIGLRFHPDLYPYAAGSSDSLPVDHPLIDNPTPPAPRRRFVDGLTYDRRRHCVYTALYSRQVMKAIPHGPLTSCVLT